MRRLTHLNVRYGVRPAIVLCGLIAGFGAHDAWFACTAVLAAWFVGAEPWEPYADEPAVTGRKSNEAPD